ncbi:uncharacterized protein CEXT_512631 [Caerostris extrusa]|uniref:Transposase n=1 Tax=Caerostris extrusa TaxID=172846 RepID=A0AAV4VAK8_CAEEX|nr:uncharacterized protein CEXT_512631 [Caerostris extrusa]
MMKKFKETGSLAVKSSRGRKSVASTSVDVATDLQEGLSSADLPVRHTFALEVLACMEVDNDCPWNILWTDNAYFSFQGFVNTQNCRIWSMENPFANVPVNVSVKVWYMLMTSFIVGPLFIEEVMVNATSLSHNQFTSITCKSESFSYKMRLLHILQS